MFKARSALCMLGELLVRAGMAGLRRDAHRKYRLPVHMVSMRSESQRFDVQCSPFRKKVTLKLAVPLMFKYAIDAYVLYQVTTSTIKSAVISGIRTATVTSGMIMSPPTDESRNPCNAHVCCKMSNPVKNLGCTTLTILGLRGTMLRPSNR